MHQRSHTASQRHTPARRLRAAAAALVLLCIAWPALAAVLLAAVTTVVTAAATHLTATATIAAGVLLLRATGPAGHRAVTALAGRTAARVLVGP